MGRYSDLLKNTILLGASKASTQLVAFILIPIYTAYMTPTDYGTADLIISYLALLVPVLMMRLDLAIFRFLIDARNDERSTNSVVSNALTFLLPITVGVTIVGCVAWLVFDVALGGLTILNFASLTMVSFLQQTARGIGRNGVFAVSTLIVAVVMLIGGVICVAVLHMASSGVLFATGTANIAGVAYLVIALRQNIRYKPALVNRTTRKELLKYGANLVPEGISWWVMNLSDRTIIAIAIGAAATGVYSVANKVGSALNAISSVFYAAWSESIALHIYDDNRSKFINKTGNSYLVAFGCLGLWVIALFPALFNLFIGEQFAEAYFIIPPLVIAAWASAMTAFLACLYLALKRPGALARTTAACALANIALCVALIKPFGLWGAADATIITCSLLAIYRYIDLRQELTLRIAWPKLGIMFGGYGVVIFIYYSNISGRMWIGPIVASAITLVMLGKKGLKQSIRAALSLIPGALQSTEDEHDGEER